MTVNLQVQVADDLRQIESMAGRLERRAIDTANARGIVGGDAMVEISPVGSLETWTNRIDGLERRWRAARDAGLTVGPMPNWAADEDPDKLWPATQLLWSRSEGYRVQLDQAWGEEWRPTLASEAKWLRNKDTAAWIAEHEPDYAGYAADVATARAKLENILREGDRSERTPIVCDQCSADRPLEKVWDKRRPARWGCTRCQTTTTEPLEACPACAEPLMVVSAWTSDPDADRWKCPACKELFDRDGLARALAAQMRRGAPREWVTRALALALLEGVGDTPAAAQRIVDNLEVPRRRDEATRVTSVSWPDVWRAHLLARQSREIRPERDSGAEWISGAWHMRCDTCEELKPVGAADWYLNGQGWPERRRCRPCRSAQVAARKRERNRSTAMS